MEKLINKALATLGYIKDCSLIKMDKYNFSITYDGLKPKLAGEKIIKELENPLAKEGWAIYVEESTTNFVSLVVEKIR